MPHCVPFVADVTFELARGRFTCGVVQSLHVVSQTMFARKLLVTLVTLKLAFVFSTRLWMICLVVGVQLFNAFVITFADLTDEVSRRHLKYQTIIELKLSKSRGKKSVILFLCILTEIRVYM